MGITKKNGKWVIDYYANGRRIRETIGASRKLAQDVLGKRKLQIAEDKFLDIKKAEKVLEVQQHDVSILMSYNSMFHSARALLYKDGIKERSHACLILYLKDKYAEDTELTGYLNSMDAYRRTRHDIQYRGSSCTELDAQEALKDAKGFLKATGKKLS